MTEISFATDFGGGFGTSAENPAPPLESVEEGRALEKFDTFINPAHGDQRLKEKKQKKKSKKKKSKKSSTRSRNKGDKLSPSSSGSRSSSKFQDSVQGSINTKVTDTSTEQGSEAWIQDDDEWLSSSFLHDADQKWGNRADPMDASSVGQTSDGGANDDASTLDAMKVFGSIDRKEWKRRSETTSLDAAASRVADAFDLYDEHHHLHVNGCGDLLLRDNVSANGDDDHNIKLAFVDVKKSGHHENNVWMDDFSVAELSKFEAFAAETTAQSVSGNVDDDASQEETINHTLVNYLTAMGLEASKAANVASHFTSTQQQSRRSVKGSSGAAHRASSSREEQSRPAPVNPDVFASKMREIEQNQTLSDFNRRTSDSTPKQTSRSGSAVNNSTSSVPLGTHLQGSDRRPSHSSNDDMPGTRQGTPRTAHSSNDALACTNNTGNTRGNQPRRTSHSSSADDMPGRRRRSSGGGSSMAAAAAAVTAAFRPPSRTASRSGDDERRSSSRRTTRPRRMIYQRAERPGAVEVSGRAFGAPHRPNVSLTPSSDDDEQPAMTIEAMAVEDFDKLNHDDHGAIVAVHAKPLSLKHALKEKSLRRLIIGGLILGGVAVIGTVSFFMTRPDPEPSIAIIAPLGEPTMAPSLAPTFIDDDVLVAAATISGWGYEGPNQAQLQAVGWLSAVDDMDNDKFGPAFAQRYALVVFYFATSGRDWLHHHSWLDPSKHECDWSDDIQCSHDSTNRRIITAFDSPRNGLSGSLPSEVFTLRAIESLVLSKNQIVGSIPSNIDQMTRLAALDLSSNQLTGPLPETIGEAKDLVAFDISENNINGTIPESFFDLALLRTLDFSSNQITGTISNSISHLQVLDTFNVRHNKISGQFPSGLDLIRTLDHIWLDHNELTGSLPSISAYQANRLELTLSNNKISGSIAIDSSIRRHLLQGDESHGEFTFRIHKIDISNNQLTGTISPVAAFLPTLRHMDISGNSFRGEFPGFAGWPVLEHMNIARNDFTGAIPHGWPSSLEYLDVAGNSVTGTIPNALCYFPNLKFLKLCNNPQLEGTIPPCFDQASSLQHLEIQSNVMDGTLPSALSRLTGLQHLDMSGNALTGTIPVEFGQLTELKTFDVRDNQLHGSIPSGVFADNMRYLKVLDLSGNTLTGMLPEGLGKLTKLEEVAFAPGNDWLQGRIPESWCSSAMNLTTTAVGCNLECSCCHDTESCRSGN